MLPTPAVPATAAASTLPPLPSQAERTLATTAETAPALPPAEPLPAECADALHQLLGGPAAPGFAVLRGVIPQALASKVQALLLQANAAMQQNKKGDEGAAAMASSIAASLDSYTAVSSARASLPLQNRSQRCSYWCRRHHSVVSSPS